MSMCAGTHGTLKDIVAIHNKTETKMNHILVLYYSIELLKCIEGKRVTFVFLMIDNE